LKLKPQRSVLLAALVVILLLCLPLGLLGKTPRISEVRRYVPARDLPKPVEKDKWVFTADKVVGDHVSEYVDATGNCTLVLGENTVRADFARYYRETGWIFLKGNIRARWEGDFLEADEAEFDLNNMLGWLKNGRIFVAKPHVYVEADLLERRPGDTYGFKNARVTRCSGERPAWSVSAAYGDIKLDGNVRIWHSVFRIKDVPVLYWPWASLPSGQKRESGWLMPEVGTSDRLGFHINQPYYWVINEEADATFYQNWMSKRGYRQGVELRYAPDSKTRAMFSGSWFNDKRVDKTEGDEDNSYNDDGLTRPNRNRWWAVGKYTGWLGSPQWKFKADLDLVSDQNYLREFNSGRLGYEAISEQLLDKMGRSVDEADSTIRTNNVFLSRSWDKGGVVAHAQYLQNLEYMNGNGKEDENPTVQTLPALDSYLWKDSLFGSMFEFEGNAQYAYFHRNYGDSGHRFDLRPSLSVPLRSRYLTVIPKASFYQTFYETDKEDAGNFTISRFNIENNATEDGFHSRTSWEGGVSLFSELERIYMLNEPLQPSLSTSGVSRWTRLRHSVSPRVEYTYRPNLTGQSKLPYFDSRDRLYGVNETTYSLTNVFDRRRDEVVMVANEDGSSTPVLKTDYLDFLTVRFSQSYDRNEATRNDERDQYERRPFSDFLAEAILKPEDFVSLTMRAWYSPYMGKVTEHEHELRFYKDGLGDIYVGLDFREPVDEYTRYQDDRMNILKAGLNWQMAENFELGLDWRQDIDDNRNLETTVNLRWKRECYDVIFYGKSEPGDYDFGVKFDLFNF